MVGLRVEVDAPDVWAALRPCLWCVFPPLNQYILLWMLRLKWVAYAENIVQNGVEKLLSCDFLFLFSLNCFFKQSLLIIGTLQFLKNALIYMLLNAIDANDGEYIVIILLFMRPRISIRSQSSSSSPPPLSPPPPPLPPQTIEDAALFLLHRNLFFDGQMSFLSSWPRVYFQDSISVFGGNYHRLET